MADYVSILAKAIGGLAQNNADNRQLIYQKARGAIDRKLRAMDPLPSEEAIADQMSQLETAINQVEGEHQLAEVEARASRASEIAAAQQPAPAPEPIQEPLVEPAKEPVQEPVAPSAPKPAAAPEPAQQQPAPASASAIPAPNPPAGFVDDVILIDGIGEKTRSLLEDEGITGLSQIAAMSDTALAAVTEKIGFPDFEKTQAWKDQASEMLAGNLPRSKTDQERLKKLQEVAAPAGEPAVGEAGPAPVTQESAPPETAIPETEAASTAEPVVAPVVEPGVEPAIEPVTASKPEVEIPAPQVGVASQEETGKSAPKANETEEISQDEQAIADAIKALSSRQNSEPAAGQPAPAADLGKPQDIPVSASPASDPFLDGPAATPQAAPQAALQAPPQVSGHVPPQAPSPADPAPAYVSELEGDPMARGASDAYTPPGSVDLGKPKKGAGKAIGCFAALAILAGLGYGAWANQDVVKPWLDKGVMAVQELIKSFSGKEPADAPVSESQQNGSDGASDQDTGSDPDSAKDSSRLGGGDEPAADQNDGANSNSDEAPVDTAGEATSGADTSEEGGPTSLLEDTAGDDGQDATVEVEGETETPADNEASGQASEQVSEENASGQQTVNESATPAILSGEKAFLYEEALGATGASRDEGGIAWSLANEAPEEGAPTEAVIRGILEVPGRGLTMNLAIKRNVDPGLPASHLIEMFFTAQNEFSGGNIDNVSRFVMKATEEARGESLVGVPARIDTGYFLIALNNLDQATQTNLRLLENADWIDVPVAYVTGRRALMTFEKGESGKKVFADALADWKNR